MKKGARILCLFMLVMIGLVFISGVVSATASDDFKQWVGKVWNAWKVGGLVDGGAGVIFLKILMTIIITLLVFSILDVAGLTENTFVLFIISFAVGIMGTYYMGAVQVKLLADIYTAFGGTLITLLPFIVLSTFTIRAIRDGNVQLMVIQQIAWILFFAFLVYTWVTKDYLVNFVFWVVLALTGILSFANGWFIAWVGRILVSAKIISAAQGAADLEVGVNVLKNLGGQVQRPASKKKAKS